MGALEELANKKSALDQLAEKTEGKTPGRYESQTVRVTLPTAQGFSMPSVGKTETPLTKLQQTAQGLNLAPFSGQTKNAQANNLIAGALGIKPRVTGNYASAMETLQNNTIAQQAQTVQGQQYINKLRQDAVREAESNLAYVTGNPNSTREDIQRAQQRYDAAKAQYQETDPLSLGERLEKGAANIVGGLGGFFENASDMIVGGGASVLADLVREGAALFGNSGESKAADALDEFARGVYETDSLGAQDWQQRVNEKYAGRITEREAKADALGASGANMLGALATGYGVGALAGAGGAALGTNAANVAQTASKVGFGLSAAGGGTKEAIQEGADVSSAVAYGTMVGLLETVAEGISGGVPGMGKGKVSEVVQKVVNKLTESGAINTAIDVLGEGGEEVFSEIFTPYLQRMFYNPEAETATLDDMAEAFVSGAALSALMQGGNYAAGRAVQAVENRAQNAQGQTALERLAGRRNVQQNQQTEIPGEAEALQRLASGEDRYTVFQDTGYMLGDDGALRSRAGVVAYTPEEVRDFMEGNKKSASLETEESTAVNTDPAQHTPAEQAVIDEYQGAVDEGLVRFVEASVANKGANRGRYVLKPVSERAAADIRDLTGVDTTGFQTVMEQRMAEHIYAEHGPNGTTDHSMADLNDIGRIQYVLDNYDAAKEGGTVGSYTTIKPNGKPGLAKAVVFEKEINGTYYVVEAVPDTKAKTTYVVSAYLSKNDGDRKVEAQYPASAQSALTRTSENADTMTSTESTIPQTDGGVNAEGEMWTDEDLNDYIDSLVRDPEAEPTYGYFTPEQFETDQQRRESIADDANAPAEQMKSEDLDELVRMWTDQANPIDQQREPSDYITNAVTQQRKSVSESIEDAWSFFKRKMVDAGDSVTQIGKTIGDKYLYPYYNLARASSQAGANMIANAQTNIAGQKVGESLNEIFKPIMEKGDDYYNKFQLYMYHRHNVARMSRFSQEAIEKAQAALDNHITEHPELVNVTESSLQMRANAPGMEGAAAQERLDLIRDLNRAMNRQNKPIFENVGAEESRETAARLERENPEFRKEAEKVYAYINNLMQYRVDSGLLSQEQADQLKAIYPDYVPTYRTTEREQARMLQNSVQIGRTVGRATGGVENLLPLHVALGRQTMSVVREGSKNRFGQRLLDDAARNRQATNRYVQDIQQYQNDVNEDTFDAETDPRPRRENTFLVYDGGKLYEMTVDPGMFEAVQALTGSAKESSSITKAIRASNDLFKKLVTGYNPTFMVRNFVRDLQDAGLNSRNITEFAKNYPLALKEIATNGEYWQQYQALGGSYSSIFDYDTGTIRERGPVAEKTIGRIEALNMAVEQAPRLAEFMAVVKNGDGSYENLMDAMLAAADITTNFGRAGSLGKVLNANFVPFLNPGIQGFDKFVRRFTETKGAKAWAELIVRVAALGFAPALINDLLFSDDDEWEDVRQSDKDTNYLFKIGDGLWLKIPKGRALSVLGMIGDRAADLVRGEDVDWGDFFTTVGNQIAPANPLENNILKAWMDADLLNTESPGRTWYGSDIESQSLQNYAPGQRYDTGTDIVSKWLGEKLNLSPQKINYLIDQYSGVIGDFALPLLTPQAERDPFTKAFTVDSVLSNNIGDEYYGTGDQLTFAANDGDQNAVIVKRFWNRQNSDVSDLYAEIREVEGSETLTDAEKRDQVRDLRDMINAIEKNTLEVLPAYQEAVERLYTEGADPDDVYREANREVFGAEYAIKVYNKETYAKAQEVVSQGVSWDDYYDYYFGVKAAEASKEEEKRTVLDQMEIPDGEKLVLYKEEIASEKKKELAQSLEEQGVQTGEIYNYIDYYGEDKFNDMLRTGVEQTVAAEVYDAVKALEPETGKSTVSAQQKYSAIVGMDMSDAEKLAAILAYDTSEDASTYAEYAEAYEAGISLQEFDEYRAEVSGITSDKDENGNTISGSKKEKVLALIDSMPITTEQKDMLYRMEGYSESTIYEAPWYRYAGQLPTAETYYRQAYTFSPTRSTIRGADSIRGANSIRGNRTLR